MTALVPAVSVPVQLSAQADTDVQLIGLWLHGRSANTQAAYQHDIAQFFSFVNKPIPTITLQDFQNFADAIQGSVGTKRRVIAAVKSLFSFALKMFRPRAFRALKLRWGGSDGAIYSIREVSEKLGIPIRDIVSAERRLMQRLGWFIERGGSIDREWCNL